MSLRNVAIVLVMALVLGGVAWLSARQTGTLPINPSSEEQEEEPNVGSDRYSESTGLYSIDITYPTVSNPLIQARIDEIVEEEIAQFKAESVSLIDDIEANRIRTSARPYELIIEHKAYAEGGLQSFEFDIYLDTGGAHPNGFFRTTTFNAQGQELMLEDLFVEGAPYFSRLSDEAYARVRAELKRRVGGEVTPDMENTIRLGTAPSPEVLQYFYLSDGELHLLFPPYQVAAYAAGSFDIGIPLSELQDILKPELQ